MAEYEEVNGIMRPKLEHNQSLVVAPCDGQFFLGITGSQMVRQRSVINEGEVIATVGTTIITTTDIYSQSEEVLMPHWGYIVDILWRDRGKVLADQPLFIIRRLTAID